MNAITKKRSRAQAPLLWLSLPGEPQSASLARRRVREALTAYVPPHVVEDVELIASELVSNALASRSRSFVLQLYFDRESGVRVTVSDPDPVLPQLQPVEPLAERGRGLQIIDALSSAWGSTARRPRGKTVWSEIPA